LSKYPKVGPFVSGGAPGIDYPFLNNVETYLGYAADSNITADGNGNMITKSTAFTVGKITRVSFFTGGGTQNNVAHGLGVTPDIVIVQYAGNFGSPPANPAYYYNANTSTVNIVGQNGYSWLAVALKF
jgi:hypothetical protein